MNDMIFTVQQSRTSGCEKNSFLFLCYIHAQSISFLIYYLERLFFAPEKSYTSRICQRGPYNRINLKVLSFILGERHTHTHKKEGRGESLRGDLGTRNNKRKTGPLQILFLCVCVLLLQLYKCERKILERKRWSRLRGACREPTHTHSRRMRATEKEKQHIHVVLIKFCAALLFSRRFLLCSVRLCVCVHTITPRIAALQQKLK